MGAADTSDNVRDTRCSGAVEFSVVQVAVVNDFADGAEPKMPARFRRDSNGQLARSLSPSKLHTVTMALGGK
jgi:hypothetical protein